LVFKWAMPDAWIQALRALPSAFSDVQRHADRCELRALVEGGDESLPAGSECVARCDESTRSRAEAHFPAGRGFRSWRQTIFACAWFKSPNAPATLIRETLFV
jgi:hypothetical protein